MIDNPDTMIPTLLQAIAAKVDRLEAGIDRLGDAMAGVSTALTGVEVAMARAGQSLKQLDTHAGRVEQRLTLSF